MTWQYSIVFLFNTGPPWSLAAGGHRRGAGPGVGRSRGRCGRGRSRSGNGRAQRRGIGHAGRAFAGDSGGRDPGRSGPPHGRHGDRRLGAPGCGRQQRGHRQPQPCRGSDRRGVGHGRRRRSEGYLSLHPGRGPGHAGRRQRLDHQRRLHVRSHRQPAATAFPLQCGQSRRDPIFPLVGPNGRTAACVSTRSAPAIPLRP